VAASMLAKLQMHTLLVPKADRHEYQASVVDMTAKAMVAIELFMEQAVQQAQAAVDGSDADKAARDAKVVAKKSELEALEAAVKQQEAALTQSSTALEEANKAAADAKAAQKAGDKAFEEAQGRVERITDALDNAFVPLKERTGDLDAKPVLKSIIAVGKAHDFDASLMTAVPVALMKVPSARSEFDNMAVTQMETALREKLSEFQKLIDEGAEGTTQRAVAVDEAVAKASVASEKKLASVAALKEAKGAKVVGGKAVSAAQESVSSFLSDMKAAGDAFDERKAALAEFRAGAKLHFGELRDFAPAIAEAEGKLPIAPSDPASPTKERNPVKSPARSPVTSPAKSPAPAPTAE